MPLTPREIVDTLREAHAAGTPQYAGGFQCGDALCATGVLLKKAVPNIELGIGLAYINNEVITHEQALKMIGLTEKEFTSMIYLNDDEEFSFGEIADQFESYFAEAVRV